ncbi:MAG: hypothetical protein P1R58_06980 [bacterium]|nr:hypothetical protein [bacterium]
MLCPKCKSELSEGATSCFVCNTKIGDGAEAGRAWSLAGYIGDKITADFANETLLSFEIPSVVISKSGFFGNAGLALTSFFGDSDQLFEISVPSHLVEEATEILNNTLGSGWRSARDEE